LENPFELALNSHHPDCTQLSFTQIEHLVRHSIQFKQPRHIPDNLIDTATWWKCDTQVLLSQLSDCLSKRGYREKELAKSINKLNEENQTDMIQANLDNPSTLNNLSCDQAASSNHQRMFEKTQQIFRDVSSDLVNTTKKSEDVNKQIYREQIKVLKYVYSLEDRVFGANLQKPADNEKLNGMADRRDLKNSHDDSENEQPIDIAVERLADLEKRIERRYLKHPFVPKKKLKLNKTAPITMDSDYSEEVKQPEFVVVVSGGNNKNKEMSITRELEQWRELVSTCRTTSQLYILADELNTAIAWDKSIMKVICQICNSDSNEDKLLLCDSCDKGYHTYCFKPQLDLKSIPEGDWYCWICIALLSDGGQKLCCVCGSSEATCPYEANPPRNTTNDMNKCEKCSKNFHGQCMPHAKYFKTSRKWHCLNCSNKTLSIKVLKTNLQVNNSSEPERSNKRPMSSNIGDAKKQPGAKKLKPSEAGVEVAVVKVKGRTKKSNTEHNTSLDDGLSESCKSVSEQENKKKSVNVESKSKVEKTKKLGPLKVNVKATTQIRTPPPTPPNHVVKERDLSLCKLIAKEMAKNESAWPFMKRVDEKDNPDYYELVKQPMDIETIQNKVKNREYKTKEQFAYDCRLIFDNCEFYNEDKSKIGQAGHKLRAFFETKFIKIFD